MAISPLAVPLPELPPIKGVLVTGGSGVGKSSLVRKFLAEQGRFDRGEPKLVGVRDGRDVARFR